VPGFYDYCVQPGYDTGNIYCNKMKLAYGYDGLAIYGGSFGGASQSFYDSIAGWQREPLPETRIPPIIILARNRMPKGNGSNRTTTLPNGSTKTSTQRYMRFANDDHQNQSGFQACPNSGELDITWCPCEGTSLEQGKFTPILRLQNEKFMRYALFAPNGKTVRSASPPQWKR